MKNKSIRIGFAITIFALGTIVPFVDYLVVIETFYLLIPLGILFLGSLIYLIVSLFSRTMRSKNALYITCLVPVFIVSQFISTYAVDKIQRYKAELLIKEIESEQQRVDFLIIMLLHSELNFKSLTIKTISKLVIQEALW